MYIYISPHFYLFIYIFFTYLIFSFFLEFLDIWPQNITSNNTT